MIREATACTSAGAVPPRACPSCALRSRLLARLAGHLDRRPRDRERLAALLALPDDELLVATGAAQRSLPGLDSMQRDLGDAEDDKLSPVDRGGAALCRHDPRYPPALRDLVAPPAAVHLGRYPERTLSLLALPAVAIVGARSPTDYGRAVARDLAGGLAGAGVCVISGMAMGIDSEAHTAGLDAGGATLAVLPGGPDVAYPATARALHRRLDRGGGLLSEMPPGVAPRRWCFVARNRIVAALASVTVVVEARERSGTLITAGYARDLGRDVAAVPGPVTSSLSSGTNALIRDGAHLVGGAREVLDLLYGVGARPSPAPGPALEPRLAELLRHVREGRDTADALAVAGVPLPEALAGLSELELLGCVTRGLSGRYLAVKG